ncbi:unnamed protein product [Caenorhabditis angaria]|uniref:Uncharacterized protein n=1 Tax=Caenorhabditis angaria TaxID=860376 RepID=A0A9P1IX62_9PELO|nr:unnamed protein product [Caenorhabditis angaria]
MAFIPSSIKSCLSNPDPHVNYSAKFTTIQDPLQKELQRATLGKAKEFGTLGAPEVLTFGENFIRAFKGKKVLDIGTYTGISALAWALALPDDGEVLTMDIDLNNYKKFGVPIISKHPETFKKIKAVEAPALETLDELIADGQSGTFDFAFIDADKENYENYYNRVVTLLKSGGVVFLDNCLWGGRVTVEEHLENDPLCAAIHKTNRIIFQDSRTYSALLNFGDGTHVAFKV